MRKELEAEGTAGSIRKLKEIHEATHPAKLERSDKSFNGEPQATPSSSQGEASASDPPTDEMPFADGEGKGDGNNDSDDEEPPLAAVPA